jgi:hypothetical protein
MPVTLHQVFDKVRAAAEAELGHAVDEEYVGAFFRATVKAIGLEINAETGEVYDPAPPRSPIPEQRNARWSGSGRRRR